MRDHCAAATITKRPRHQLTPLFTVVLLVQASCTRQLTNADLLTSPELHARLTGSKGIEVSSFTLVDGTTQTWPGCVTVDSHGRYVFTLGGRLGDPKSLSDEHETIVKANELAYVSCRDEAISGVVAACGLMALVGVAVAVVLSQFRVPF